jgi:hypothetical protein
MAATPVEDENESVMDNDSSSVESDVVQRMRSRKRVVQTVGTGLGDATAQRRSMDEKDESFEEGSIAASIVSE